MMPGEWPWSMVARSSCRAVVLFVIFSFVTIKIITVSPALRLHIPNSTGNSLIETKIDVTTVLPIRNCQLVANGGTRGLWDIETFLQPHNATKDDEWAVCAHDGSIPHFPHAAQHLFRCWSYWRYRSNLQPVLWVLAANVTPHHEYTRWILDRMEETIGLVVLQEGETNTTLRGAIQKKSGRVSYGLRSTDDARAFRSMVAPGATDTTAASPRIAVLNRSKSRTIVASQRLAEALRQEFNSSVPIVYFEDKSVMYQMDFMANTDVLITPHGAQVTSIIAMPQCGALVEIYPKEYYPLSFFGSLADASGILHLPVYLGEMETKNVNASFMPSYSLDRAKARGVSLYPNLDNIVSAVKRIVAARRVCISVNQTQTVEVERNLSQSCEA